MAHEKSHETNTVNVHVATNLKCRYVILTCYLVMYAFFVYYSIHILVTAYSNCILLLVMRDVGICYLFFLTKLQIYICCVIVVCYNFPASIN